PELGDLGRREGRDGKLGEGLPRADFDSAAEQIAVEAAGGDLDWAGACDGARGVVAEGAEADGTREIERAPCLHAIGAEMRGLEMAAGDALAHREIRAAAAHAEAKQQIGGQLIVDATGETAGVVVEAGKSGVAIELPAAVKAGGPGAPARLIDRRRL